MGYSRKKLNLTGQQYLGSYKRFEDAVKVRKRGEEELYHPFLAEYDQAAIQ